MKCKKMVVVVLPFGGLLNPSPMESAIARSSSSFSLLALGRPTPTPPPRPPCSWNSALGKGGTYKYRG
ncbi:unnamed protein product [Linum tenue]|uniref:Secreted protein n=1 Tax=Linum tenue TaxID=586396 RepID=A0AAV0MC38_9ROSI|nr:unnamed protein product [Linum tenue]